MTNVSMACDRRDLSDALVAEALTWIGPSGRRSGPLAERRRLPSSAHSRYPRRMPSAGQQIRIAIVSAFFHLFPRLHLISRTSLSGSRRSPTQAPRAIYSRSARRPRTVLSDGKSGSDLRTQSIPS